MLQWLGCLPTQRRAGIVEVHFLPFNPVDKRTALTYIDTDGSWHRASKGALEKEKPNGSHCKALNMDFQAPETGTLFSDWSSYRELSEIAEQARRLSDVARLRELHTLKGHVGSVARMKGLDIDTTPKKYTV